jgi:hypothetical protein
MTTVRTTPPQAQRGGMVCTLENVVCRVLAPAGRGLKGARHEKGQWRMLVLRKPCFGAIALFPLHGNCQDALQKVRA